MRWFDVVFSAQIAPFTVTAAVCRLTSGTWWPSSLRGLLGVSAVSTVMAHRDRVLARRQFDGAS